MLFNSWVFIAFLALTFLVYYWGLRWARNAGIAQIGVLIVSALVFYGYDQPLLLVPFAVSLVANGFFSEALLSSKSRMRKRALLVFALAFNLGILGFFKYAGFLAQSLLPPDAYAFAEPFVKRIPLPIGISFYTFTGLSLLIDAYAGKLPAAVAGTHRFGFHARIWAFISFFPRLVAGPIERVHGFLDQLSAKRFADIDWNDATRKLVTGYFLKMVVADNLKEATLALAPPFCLKCSKLQLLALLYGYSFQIFADFAGYSLIAMGLARLFGYRLVVNFNFPYLSQSISEFWRRWHMSLSMFFRDYLYIPLGGSREGKGRTYFNLLVVMCLVGLWHGAAWGYIIWGGVYGALLVLERFWKWHFALKQPTRGRLKAVVKIFVTFHVVTALWLLFRLPQFTDLASFAGAFLRNPWWGFMNRYVFILIAFSPPVILYHLWGGGWKNALPSLLGRERATLVENCALGFMAFLIVVNAGTPGTFIYFQF